MSEKKADPNQRSHLRIEVALQIKFRSLEDLEHMIGASTLNLSKGGMFIYTDKLRKKGHRVKIELPLSDSRTVEISGTIRHLRYLDGKPFGMGIEFDELHDEARKAIEEILARTANHGP